MSATIDASPLSLLHSTGVHQRLAGAGLARLYTLFNEVVEDQDARLAAQPQDEPSRIPLLWRSLAETVGLTVDNDGRIIDGPRAEILELVTCYVRPTKAVRYQIDDDDLRPTILLELKRLATPNGEAPSKNRWNQQRRPGLPTAQHVCRILNAGWSKLCLEAGLLLNPYAKRSAWRVDGGPPVIDAAAEDTAEDTPILDDDDYARDWPTIGQRTEVHRSGNIQTTRVYHMLR